jgi:hypothetical protein
MTKIHERRRLRARMARAAQQPRSHYLISGLAVGGLWLLNGDKSLLYHAVQMLAVMSVLTGLQIVIDRRHGGTPAYARLISAKLALVAVAAARNGWAPAGHAVQHHRRHRPGRPDHRSRARELDRLAARRDKGQGRHPAGPGPPLLWPPAGASAPQPGRPARSGPAPGHREDGPHDRHDADAISTDASRFRRAWLSGRSQRRTDHMSV